MWEKNIEKRFVQWRVQHQPLSTLNLNSACDAVHKKIISKVKSMHEQTWTAPLFRILVISVKLSDHRALKQPHHKWVEHINNQEMRCWPLLLITSALRCVSWLDLWALWHITWRSFGAGRGAVAFISWWNSPPGIRAAVTFQQRSRAITPRVSSNGARQSYTGLQLIRGPCGRGVLCLDMYRRKIHRVVLNLGHM